MENRVTPQAEAGRSALLQKKRAKDHRRWEKQIASGQTVPAIVHARLQAKKLRDDVKVRLAAIRREVLGEYPRFFGTLITDPDMALLPDRQMLKAMAEDGHGCVTDGSALVYWTDGAVVNLEPSATGQAVYLGAGVVKADKSSPAEAGKYRSDEFLAGCDTGNIGDAEMYAISVAVQLAIQEIKNGNDKVQRVRVLTDRRPIIETINSSGHSSLGPLISSHIALKGLYEGAAWLDSNGIRFEMVWVKGHGKSKGNKLADEAALRAAKTQANISLTSAAEAKETRGIKTEAPTIFVEKGAAWRDEWLWRANKSFLVKSGKAIDWHQSKD